MYLQWNRCLINRKTWESHNLQAPILIILGERWTSTSTSYVGFQCRVTHHIWGIWGIEKESFSVQRRQSEELTSIQKRLIFQWTPTQLLGGLMVDNYEAMTIIPPQAVGCGDPAGDCFHLLPIFSGCVSSKCCMDPSMPSHGSQTHSKVWSVEDLGNLSSCRHGMVASIYKSVGDFNALQIPNWGITRPGKHTKNYWKWP